MPTIHLVDGEKGGVGKSVFAKVMIQYALDRDLEFDVVETDRSNPDVANVYNDISKRAVLTENEKQAHKADRIFELAMRRSLIVSLPSQVHRPLRAWIEKNKLLELGEQYGVGFCKWFVCNGEFDSVKLFRKSLNFYGDKIPHILVRNFGLCDDWQQIDNDQEVQKSIEQFGAKVIDFPSLPHNERYIVNMHQLRFDAARESDKLTILGRQRVVNFLDEAYLEIDSTGMWLQPENIGELRESA